MNLDPSSKAIVDAVIPLFSRYGFKKTSIDDIARAARVSKATLYSRFGGKEELFATVVRVVAERLLQSIQEAADEVDGYEAKLRAMLSTHLVQLSELASLAKMSSEVIQELMPLAMRVTEEFGMRHLMMLEGLLSDGVAAGKLHMSSPTLVAYAIQTAIKHLHMHLLDQEHSKFKEGLEELLEIFMRGVTYPRSDTGTEVTG